MDIAALVIVYNYDASIVENILSYSGQVKKVFIVDNSDAAHANRSIFNKIENTEYWSAGENIGISMAINLTAKKAIEEGFNWLITFDQDSVAEEAMIDKMKAFILRYEKQDIGILAPVIKSSFIRFKKLKTEFSYFDSVIQSGALHNLVAFEEVQGYDEKLFIDQVDIEYCIRLRTYGYKIIKLNDTVLVHNVNDEKVKLLYIDGRKYFVDKYSPMRYYYIIRNNLYCKHKYRKKDKVYALECKNAIIVLKETLRYDNNKKEKRKAVRRAYTDYYFKRMGK